jgi:hypothetical protein
MGGLLLIIACAIVFFYLRKRRRQKRTQHTQLTPTSLPKPQPSRHIEHVDDTSPNIYSDNNGSGNHTSLSSPNDGRQTNTSPPAGSGIAGLEITSRKGVRDAVGAQAR